MNQHSNTTLTNTFVKWLAASLASNSMEPRRVKLDRWLVLAIGLAGFASTENAIASEQNFRRSTLPQSLQVKGSVGSDCNISGTIIIAADGQVKVNCQIRNSHRVRGYTGQLAIGFYDSKGKLIAEQAWNRGIDARNPLSGKTKSSSVGSSFAISKSQLESFQTIKVVVRHNESSRVFKEIEDVLKIDKSELKQIPQKVKQSAEDVNIFDEKSSLREHLAKNDPLEKAKEDFYFEYRRSQMRAANESFVLQLQPGNVHYERLVQARDEKGNRLFPPTFDITKVKWYYYALVRQPITLGHNVLVTSSYGNIANTQDASVTALMAHELTHVLQVDRMGGEANFGRRYVSQSVKYGVGGFIIGGVKGDSAFGTAHDAIPLEQEANRVETQFNEWYLRVGLKNEANRSLPAPYSVVLKPKSNLPLDALPSQALKHQASLAPKLGITGISTPEGLRVESVSGGLAIRLGLEPGDLIVQIDGNRIYSPSDVSSALVNAITNKSGNFQIVVKNVRFGRVNGAQEFVVLNEKIGAP